MRQVNIIPEYNTITKFFHWISVAGLIVQIPLGFYLVDLDFSDTRILIEDIHVILGMSIFYITLFRILFRLLLSSPEDPIQGFPGQMIVAKINHFLLYLTLLTVTTSGMLKKLLTLIYFLYNHGLLKRIKRYCKGNWRRICFCRSRN